MRCCHPLSKYEFAFIIKENHIICGKQSQAICALKVKFKPQKEKVTITIRYSVALIQMDSETKNKISLGGGSASRWIEM